MEDRLQQLLGEHEHLYGVICRDPTLTDIELIGQEGYHVIWLDLEHSAISTAEALRLCRTIDHLGMVAFVRILELTRTHVQHLLDGGAHGIILPDVRSADQAEQLVRLGKYPPRGERGVSTCSAGTGFTLRGDPQRALADANEQTHLVAMIESDEGFDAIEQIVQIDGIDLITVGPLDWSVNLGLFGDLAKKHLKPKIEHVLKETTRAGKIAAMGTASAAQAHEYAQLGVRIFFVGVDVNLKRKIFSDTVDKYREELAGR